MPPDPLPPSSGKPLLGKNPDAWFNRIPKPVLIVGGTVVLVGGYMWYRKYRSGKADDGSPLDQQYEYAMPQSGAIGSGGGSGGGSGEEGSGEDDPRFAELQTAFQSLKQMIGDMQTATPTPSAGTPGADKQAAPQAVPQFITQTTLRNATAPPSLIQSAGGQISAYPTYSPGVTLSNRGGIQSYTVLPKPTMAYVNPLGGVQVAPNPGNTPRYTSPNMFTSTGALRPKVGR